MQMRCNDASLVAKILRDEIADRATMSERHMRTWIVLLGLALLWHVPNLLRR